MTDINASAYLVLEDDFEFAENWSEIEEQALQELDSLDWDIATLGYEEVENEGDPGTHYNYWATFNGGLLGSHAYLVNPKARQTVLDHMYKVLNGRPGDPLLGPMGPDGAINTLTWVDQSVKRVVLKKGIVRQRSSASDCNPNALDRIKPLKKILRSSLAARIKKLIRNKDKAIA